VGEPSGVEGTESSVCTNDSKIVDAYIQIPQLGNIANFTIGEYKQPLLPKLRKATYFCNKTFHRIAYTIIYNEMRYLKILIYNMWTNTFLFKRNTNTSTQREDIKCKIRSQQNLVEV
jgi:hypothetical protein